MTPPQHFHPGPDFATYRPLVHVTFPQAIDLFCAAISFARENGIRRLLVDATQVTGFQTITTLERFTLAERGAAAADSRVIVAMVARPEWIDPQRFAVTVARNRGLLTHVGTSLTEAAAWLMEGEGK